MVPLEPASASWWQPPQPFSVKTAFPSPGGPPAAPGSPSCGPAPPLVGGGPPPASASHLSKSAWLTTLTLARIAEWPAPQSSAQTTSWRPILFGVARHWVVMPGTASDLSRKFGIQNEWITSRVEMSKWTGLSTGR